MFSFLCLNIDLCRFILSGLFIFTIGSAWVRFCFPPFFKTKKIKVK